MVEGVIRIGEGAGYSGAWLEPAVDLAARGALDYLLFECLAERTIALAQLARLAERGGAALGRVCLTPQMQVRHAAPSLGPTRPRHGRRRATRSGAPVLSSEASGGRIVSAH